MSSALSISPASIPLFVAQLARSQLTCFSCSAHESLQQFGPSELQPTSQPIQLRFWLALSSLVPSPIQRLSSPRSRPKPAKQVGPSSAQAQLFLWACEACRPGPSVRRRSQKSEFWPPLRSRRGDQVSTFNKSVEGLEEDYLLDDPDDEPAEDEELEENELSEEESEEDWDDDPEYDPDEN